MRTIFPLFAVVALSLESPSIAHAGDIYFDHASPLAGALGGGISGDLADSNDPVAAAIAAGALASRSTKLGEDHGLPRLELGDVTVQAILVRAQHPRMQGGREVHYSSSASPSCLTPGEKVRLDLWIEGTAPGRVKLVCSPEVGRLGGEGRAYDPFVCFRGSLAADPLSMKPGRRPFTYYHEEGDGGSWQLTVNVIREDTGQSGRLTIPYYVECRAE